jgi:hypothetical protein
MTLRWIVTACAFWLAGSAGAAVVLDITPDQTIELAHLESESAGIKIDGKLDESVWATLPAYDDFRVIEPDTLAEVPYFTNVRVFYTMRGLYMGIDMEQPPDTLISRLSGRDDWRINRDSVGLTLDTSGEGRYGYWFEVALGDSLSDGTLLPERQYSRNWDGPWRGASSRTSNGWSVEFMIPWSTVSMPEGGDVRRMGMYMSRKVAYRDERWGWPALPWTQPKFMSVLQPLEMTGVAPRQQYNIYPFASVTTDEVEDKVRYKAGVDIFWRPTTNTQLTATLNPDFGTVESDDVVINLTATETFFPEKRLFFLEGQDIFVATPRAEIRGRGVGQGGAPYTMVNTRRIGGPPRDPEFDDDRKLDERVLLKPVELLGAAKVTGQVGRFRYGALAAFEEDYSLSGVCTGDCAGVLDPGFFALDRDGNDYGIARLLYEDSVGGAYRAVGVLSTAVLNPERDAIVHGLDWHYLTANGKLKVDGQAFVSDIDDERTGEETGYGGFVDFEYTFSQGVRQRLGIEYLDQDVNINDLGFLERNDSFRIRAAHSRTKSDLGWARDNDFDVRAFAQRNDEGDFTGGGVFVSDRLALNNLSRLVMRGSYFPASYDDLNSFGNGTYKIEQRGSLNVFFETDSSQPLQLGFGGGWRQEHLGGNTYRAEGKIVWRPSDRFNLRLDLAYDDRHGWLLHQQDSLMNTFDAEQWLPKFSADYFLTARQQFRVSLQWVGIKAIEDETFLIPEEPGDLIPIPRPDGPPRDFSISQLSLQLRYRWEIAPLSDLFIVYTRLADETRPLRGESFKDIFTDAYDAPLVDGLVVKLRYRLGS